jgi:hypothetical protein
MRYLAAFAFALPLAACVAAGPPSPIPPPMAETMPKPPVSAVPLTWQPGHWDWNGSSYTWAPGQYVDLGGHPGNWQPPYWQQTGGGWVWQPGHWV